MKLLAILLNNFINIVSANTRSERISAELPYNIMQKD
jgi:hypothetical protein